MSDNVVDKTIINFTYNESRERHFFTTREQNKEKENVISESKDSNDDYAIRDIVSDFISKVTGSANNFNFLRRCVDGFAEKTIQEEFFPLLEAKGKKLDCEPNIKISYEIETDIIDKERALSKNLSRFITANNSLGPMVLLNMAAQYDVFISSLIGFYLNKYPGILDNSDKYFTLSELKKLGSIEEAQQRILEREIDEVMFDSHLNQIEWFDKKLKKNIKSMLRDIPSFCEIFERRNLYAHSSDLVSVRYINNCKKYGSLDKDLPSVGVSLISGGRYIFNASRILLEHGLIIAQVVWRTLHKSDKNLLRLADEMVIKDCAFLYRSGQLELAIYLLDLTINRLKPSSDMHMREMVIRQASYLLADKKEAEAKKLLEKYDWTASNSRLLFYIEAISGNEQEAARLMKICKNQNEMDADEILKSPAFSRLLSTDRFKASFDQLYGPDPQNSSSHLVTQETEKSREA